MGSSRQKQKEKFKGFQEKMMKRLTDQAVHAITGGISGLLVLLTLYKAGWDGAGSHDSPAETQSPSSLFTSHSVTEKRENCKITVSHLLGLVIMSQRHSDTAKTTYPELPP